MSARKQAAKIRKILKGRCPTLSVRMDTGTASEWIRINGSKNEFGGFTPKEKKCLDTFGIETGLGGGALLMPDEKEFFIKNERVAKDRSRFKHW